MNEVKESLRNIEQYYKLFQQQQFTFVGALEHTRENAHDKIRPVASIGQVQSYMEHYCNNATDRRILLMFLSICEDLTMLCQKLEAVHPGNSITNSILEKCKVLLSHSNNLSNIRAKYPHDVVNHLSCDEARNHYGGVVSLIPIVTDYMKEWMAHAEKLPRHVLHDVSDQRAGSQVKARQEASARAVAPPGLPPASHVATQTLVSCRNRAQDQRSKDGKKHLRPGSHTGRFLNGPWKPPGKHSF
ncbi:sperm acrosome-associated protein 9 isoform X1 [Alligator mississippiensis]|uniref:sperm acrosome-associated protein 9 isoform X1 n=1 Tax=Alligator mississippiensis TaxID=8496 RepID=UPI0009074170|nr:sperm acrosome-associated protein 9 isoform X1 [Alligator mississippiensis]